MKTKQSLKRWALGLAAFALPLAVAAHGPVQDMPGNFIPDHCMPPPMTPGAAALPLGGMLPGLPPMAMLNPTRGVELSEAQQDKVFALLHAEIPGEREAMKRVFRTLEELRGLVASEPFDMNRGHALAERHGEALAQLMLKHAKRDANLRELMTPEQRKQFDDAAKQPDPRPGFKRP